MLFPRPRAPVRIGCTGGGPSPGPRRARRLRLRTRPRRTGTPRGQGSGERASAQRQRRSEKSVRCAAECPTLPCITHSMPNHFPTSFEVGADTAALPASKSVLYWCARHASRLPCFVLRDNACGVTHVQVLAAVTDDRAMVHEAADELRSDTDVATACLVRRNSRKISRELFSCANHATATVLPAS